MSEEYSIVVKGERKLYSMRDAADAAANRYGVPVETREVDILSPWVTETTDYEFRIENLATGLTGPWRPWHGGSNYPLDEMFSVAGLHAEELTVRFTSGNCFNEFRRTPK